MATSSAAMKASLVLMLLLGAAVAAHGRPVECENKCPVPIWVGGVKLDAGVKANVEVDDLVAIYFHDKLGVKLFGSFSCPADVEALALVYEEGCVKVKVAAVGLIAGLVKTLLGFVLCLVKAVL